MADILGIVITDIGGFSTWFYDQLKLCDPIETIIVIILGYMAWSYDKGRRYNYLADRWNTLMNMNADMPDFFDAEKTKEYKTWNNKDNIIKYCQYARMCWGFVEDVIRTDYSWGIPRSYCYVTAYEDTILDFISLHHAWLRDNPKFFNYPKFSAVLKKERFREQICEHDPMLCEWLSKGNLLQ